MTKALAAFESWKKVAPHERADYLFKAAKLMRERKHELSAWMILEVGKSWAEADGDVAEAIDFCEYYGREMLRLSQPAPLTKLAGESNQLAYIPLGVGLIIPPWNFPLAIYVGMTTAAIVAGNTVIQWAAKNNPQIKPSYLYSTGLVWAIALRKDSAALRNALDVALECLKTDGTIAKLHEKWFGTKPAPGSAAVTAFAGYGVPDMAGYDPTVHQTACK